METLAGLAVLALLSWIVWQWWKTKTHEPKGTVTSYDGPSEQAGREEEDYVLEWFEAEAGRGYVVKRASDGQRLRWQTLPRSKGMEAVRVAGVSHRADALQKDAFAPGSELKLVREPDNPHDENAVAVFDAEERHQVGYVPAEEAPRIARRLDAGEDLRCFSMFEVLDGGERVALRVLLVDEGVHVLGSG